jgi:hypothetical protein
MTRTRYFTGYLYIGGVTNLQSRFFRIYLAP